MDSNSRIRVLCIEDNPGTAQLMVHHLSKENCDVVVASDGESGLALSYIQSFDVILIDQALPGMSGLEVLEEIHLTNDFPPATIMITGTGDEQTAVAAMKVGANDYIVKDVGNVYLELLSYTIRSAIDHRDLQRSQHQLLVEQARLIEDLQAFGYAVAHDLKQPISVLQTSLDLLNRYINNDDETRAYHKIQQLQDTVSKMTSTLDSLILFARIRETTEIEMSSVNMHDLINDVQGQLDHMITASGATITVQSDLPIARGYAPWIERIWENYISNAIKYGGHPPALEIGSTPYADDVVAYWVKDNGEGFDSLDKEKLFLPFSRLRERKVSGQGLGLAIVSLIVRRLGGEVIVNSKRGEGSLFGFTLNRVPIQESSLSNANH